MPISNWSRVVFFNLFSIAILAVVFLFTAEFIARWKGLGFVRYFEESPTRGWKVRPYLDFAREYPGENGTANTTVRFRTNAKGFRIDHPPEMVKKAVFRIVILGDSFTLGAPIPEASVFPFVLERSLTKRLRVPVEVINMGVSAYNVRQERVLLQELGFTVNPTLVLVALYLGNDLQEIIGLHRRVYDPKTGHAREAPDHRIVEGQLVPLEASKIVSELSLLKRIKLWLYENSALYAVFVPRIKRIRVARQIGEAIGAVEPISATPSAEEMKQRLWGGEGTVSLLRESPPALEKAWRLTMDELDAMTAICRREGVHFAVIVIPYTIQVVPEVLQEKIRFHGLRAEDIDIEGPNKRIAEWGKVRGVPVIDLLDAFRKAEDPAVLYWKNDIHWSEKGHLLAGYSLADQLIAKRLVQTSRERASASGSATLSVASQSFPKARSSKNR